MKKLTLGDVCKKASSNIAQKDLLARTGKYPIFGASGFIKNVDFYHQNEEYIAVVAYDDGAFLIIRCELEPLHQRDYRS